MSDGVVRKRGRPKKVVAEAATNGDGSNNGSKDAATLNGTSSSSPETPAPKKKLSESKKKSSTATKGSKENCAEEQETPSTTSKKRRSSKKSIPEETTSDKGGIGVVNNVSPDKKTKTKRKKAEPKVVEPDTSTSTLGAGEITKSKTSNGVAGKKVSTTEAGAMTDPSATAIGEETVKPEADNDATSSTFSASEAAANGVQPPGPSKQEVSESLEPETQPESQVLNPSGNTSTSATSVSDNQSKPSVPPSKILDELARQKTTSGYATNASLSSQKQSISKPAKPEPPTSASASANTSNPRPSNPLPSPKRTPKVLDAQALKDLNSRRGTAESKAADIRATKQYKTAARKYVILSFNFFLFLCSHI